MTTAIGVTGWFVTTLATRSWEQIDDYLATRRPRGRFLASVIRTICARQRTHGIPISLEEEIVLIALYDTDSPPSSFVNAWGQLA